MTGTPDAPGAQPLTPAQQALRHLQLLGKDPDSSWFRAIRHGKGANSRRDGADLYGFSRDALRADAIDGHALYLVVGDASTASGKHGGVTDADITSIPALFVEWDDISTDEQFTAWQRLKLPQPTLMLTTGGKSVHAYWRLEHPLSPADWKAVTAQLIQHCSSDKSCRNPSRVMRLAGSLYIDKATGQPTGTRAEIIHEAPDAIYPIEEITACLPQPEPPAQPVDPSPAPSAPADPRSVEQLLSRDLLRTWEQGAPEGQRNASAFSLACSLLAHHDAAIAAGLPVTGTPEDALLQFASRCRPPIEDSEVRGIFRSAWSAPRSTDPGWPDRLRFHLNRNARDRRPAAPPSPLLGPAAPSAEGAPDAAPEPPPIRPASGGDFTCLGFDADGYYYQPHGTGQVMRLSRSAHTGTNLVALAPLSYWVSLYYGKNAPNWTAAASDLFEQQAKVGVYSPDRIRGRGAWWDHGRAVLHLGDRLLVNGTEHQISRRLSNSSYLYQRLAAIDGLTGIDPLTDNEAFPILDIASRFHWEVPASGLLIAGWATLAPICGALQWRPHVWLTAGAGSGKSTLLDSFLGPLLGPVGLWPEGTTTEASIRQELRADALPVVFDEAESNEKADQARIQSILALARVASSSGRGFIGKGSADGTSQRFTIRSMFLLSSISTALKQGADKSRFAQLTLVNPNHIPKLERTAHWEELKRDLERHITDEIGRRLVVRTIGLIPVIRESSKIFRRVAADHFDSQRLGDQYGTLLAGAWSLTSSIVPTEQQALDLIRSNDWEPYQQTTEQPDEVRCIQTILQHQLRVELDHGTVTRTIGELVAIAGGEIQFSITSETAEAILSRHGLRVEDGCLLVSNTAQAIATILRDTAWSFSWATILARLPGATKAGVVRFKGLGATSRAVRVPLAAL